MIVTADLHLTDRPRDEYRFGLFPWLAKQQAIYKPRGTFILGDLTDFKDRHPSRLVNRIVQELLKLKPPVYILMGNHDYVDEKTPFFEFLDYIEGLHFVNYRLSPWAGLALIPHCADQAAFNEACSIIRPGDTLMIHQTIDGAIAETGSHLKGLAWPPRGLEGPPARVLAGDIHRPQLLANGVQYVGAPYAIRFGDDFTPRVMLIDKGQECNLLFPAPRKWTLTIRDANELAHKKLAIGDQVKITLELAREEAVEWATNRKAVMDVCKDMGLEVHGLDLKIKSKKRERLRIGGVQAKSPEEVFEAFCTSEGTASNIKKAGECLISIK